MSLFMLKEWVRVQKWDSSLTQNPIFFFLSIAASNCIKHKADRVKCAAFWVTYTQRDFFSSCAQHHLRASMDLMKSSPWSWPAPSQGHHLCLGCIHTLPVASQSYNRLWTKKKKEEIYMVIQFFSLPRSSNEWIYKLNSSLFLFFPAGIHNAICQTMRCI